MSSRKFPPLNPHTRRTLIVPKVTREYFSQGIRLYDADNGKTYQADIYDVMLVPMRQRILPKQTPISVKQKRRRK